MLTDKLLASITAEEKDREYQNPIRLSNSGKCARAIAYQLHFPNKLIPLSARSRMVFRLGDTIEAELKSLLKKYPPEGIVVEMPDEQIELKIRVGDEVIHGHPDGLVTINGEKMVLEIKSAADYRYKRTVKGELDYGYACQATAYMHALGLEKTIFIFYNKNTSHIDEFIFKYQDSLYKEIKARFVKVFKSSPEELPDREYNPNAKGKLPWQCSYCNAVKLCYPEHEVSFDDKNKPVLTITEVKHERSSED